MFKRILFFTLLSFLMLSCIKDSLDDCDRSLRLQFRYLHNNQSQDLLTEQVQDIRVYLFDQNTGVLVNIIPVGVQDIALGYVDVDVNEGLYTAVAWGGSSINMMQGGYRDATATNPATNTYAPIAIGTTTLEQFRMILTYNPLSGNSFAQVAPQKEDFDDLFFAIAEDISVAGWNKQIVPLDLIKNTSTLKVVATGFEHLRSRALSDIPVDIFTTGKNWLYTYNNAPDIYTPRMIYRPYDATLGANNTIEIFIKQQRLNINQSVTEPVLLYIRNTDSNTNIIAPIDLISAIRQNPNYLTQSAIDREDLFVIEVSILHDLEVVIVINGWKVVILDPLPV
ncbi:MAG: FimB/Mfa2 family fimbrial subunit [Dysgonamonadaceae bacterium]|jgi:hypothetical protein|nr:FimB/Mfa2 family fimbrial subunit [Dysgonamonadaceae bacterium]